MTMDKAEGEAVMEVERLSKLGTARFQQGHKKKALEAYHNAHKASQSLGQFGYIQRACAFNLGAMYISYGQNNEGLTYLNQAIPPEGKRDGRSNGDLFFNFGLAYEGLKNWTESLKNFDKALSEYRSEETNEKMETDSIQRLGKISKDAGLFEEADSWLQQLTSACRRMGENEKLLQAQSERARLLLEKLNKANMAEEVADQCFDECERAPASRVAGYVLVELVLVYTQTHNYDKAIQCCEKALSMSNTFPAEPRLTAVVFQNLGAIYNHIRQYERAIDYHNKATERHALLKDRRSQGHCFMNMGYAYSQLGDLGKAGENFLHALQAAKDCGDKKTEWQSLESLGAVAYNQKDFNRAQALYSEAFTAFTKSPEAASIETQERILSKLKEIMQQQVSKGPQDIDRSNFDGKNSEESEEESESEEEKERKEEPVRPEPPKKKVQGQIIAVRRGSKVKFLKVRRSGTLKRFKKVALGLDDGLTDTKGTGDTELFNLFKAKKEVSEGEELSSGGDSELDEDHANRTSVVEIQEGNVKRYLKLRNSGDMKKFKVSPQGAVEGAAGGEKEYEVLVPDGDLETEDGLTSQEDEEKDYGADKESTKIRGIRPPDSYVKSPASRVMSDTMSGSEDVAYFGVNDDSDEDKEKMMAEMAKISTEEGTAKFGSLKREAVEGQPKNSGRADESSDGSSSDYDSEFDDEYSRPGSKQKGGLAPAVPTKSPPQTGDQRTYEKPLMASEGIYETIDHRPPSGRQAKQTEQAEAMRPGSRMGRNTPGMEEDSEDDANEGMSRAERDVAHFKAFQEDMKRKKRDEAEKHQEGDEKSSKHCIVM